MSFVAKGIKKIFKTVKTVVSKTMSFAKRLVKSDWFKVAVIVGLTLFTAGVAAGGFQAFNGVNTLSGFFGAVGDTMAAGFTQITTGIAKAGRGFANFFSGGAQAAEVATAPGAFVPTGTIAGGTVNMAGELGAMGVPTAAQLANTGVAAIPSMAQTLTGGAAGQVLQNTVAPTGFFSKLGNLFMADTVGGSMLRTGVMLGIMNYSQAKQAEKEEGYWRNRTIWGGAAFGGTAEGLNFGVPTQTYGQPAPAPGYEGMSMGAPQGPSYVQELLGTNDPNSIQWNPNQVAPDQQGLLATGGMPFQQIANTGVPAQQTQPPPSAPQQGRAERPPQPNIVQLENMGVI